MIAALVAFLLIYFSMSSSSVAPQFDQAAAQIKKDVTEESRQKQALSILDQMKAVTKTYADKREKSIDAIQELAAKRETPSSALESVAQPLVADDRAAAEKLLDLRFQLKAVLTATEWAKVFPPLPAPPAGKKSA
jgi:DNA helicase IV